MLTAQKIELCKSVLIRYCPASVFFANACCIPAGLSPVHKINIAGPTLIRKACFDFIFSTIQCGLNFSLISLAGILTQQAFGNLFGACLVSGLNVALKGFDMAGERHFGFFPVLRFYTSYIGDSP